MHACRGLCHLLKGYEKGSKSFVSEGKLYCSACKYKILPKDIPKQGSFHCLCCGATYRRTSIANKKKKLIQLDNKIRSAIVAIYQIQK